MDKAKTLQDNAARLAFGEWSSGMGKTEQALTWHSGKQRTDSAASTEPHGASDMAMRHERVVEWAHAKRGQRGAQQCGVQRKMGWR